jgi:hypothetical protein
VTLFAGRPFQAVVAAKNNRFRRPEKEVLHFFTASKLQRGIELCARSLVDRRVDLVVSSAAGRYPPVKFAVFLRQKPDASAFRLIKSTRRYFSCWNFKAWKPPEVEWGLVLT